MSQLAGNTRSVADEFEVDLINESVDVDEEVASGAGSDVLARTDCCLAEEEEDQQIEKGKQD